jgi:hypothetical protein
MKRTSLRMLNIKDGGKYAKGGFNTASHAVDQSARSGMPRVAAILTRRSEQVNTLSITQHGFGSGIMVGSIAEDQRVSGFCQCHREGGAVMAREIVAFLMTSFKLAPKVNNKDDQHYTQWR